MHPITTRAATFIIQLKTSEEMTIITRQNFASLRKQKSALNEKNAEGPTTELSASTTKTSTRLNSVINFLQKLRNASMGTTARLRTQSKI